MTTSRDFFTFTAEGHSIYIRNLPYDMMPAQLEAEFKKFGPIKQGGIQVRYNKVGLKCFEQHIDFWPLNFIFPDKDL